MVFGEGGPWGAALGAQDIGQSQPAPSPCSKLAQAGPGPLPCPAPHHHQSQPLEVAGPSCLPQVCFQGP